MTIWTNDSGLPAPLVDAVVAEDYQKVGDISVTEADKPVRIRALERRHADEITEDVSDGIWRLLGSIGHKILERADTTNHLSEERLTAKVLGWTISGKPDLLGPDMILDDYKFTSVYAIKNEKAEWVNQLNAYAWLYRKHGFEVKRARIIALLRDWSKMAVKRIQLRPTDKLKTFNLPEEADGYYPQVGVVVREIPLWDCIEQENYIVGRIQLHQRAETLSDDDLPLCTPEERWQKPEVFAVKKKGNKRALPGGLHSTFQSAIAWQATTQHPAEIEHRPAVDTRCLHYCRVAQFCSHGKMLLAKGGNDDEN